MEEEWLACRDVWEMFGRFRFPASERKLRLFSVVCCRCSGSLLANPFLRRAVNLVEQFADGHATEEELHATFLWASNLTLKLRKANRERKIHRWAEAAAVMHSTAPADRGASMAAETGWHIARATVSEEVEATMAALLRDIVGNPFRPLSRVRPTNPSWLTPEVITMTGAAMWRHLLEDPWFNPEWVSLEAEALARRMYDSRDFSDMPKLADLLEAAGCRNADVLDHCRGAGPHVRGCWVVDFALGLD
jgi:hypothetical protein